MDTHGFVRVPPDSTGKRIVHSVMIELEVNGITDQSHYLVGESVSFATSGFSGQLSEVEWINSTTADLHVSLYDPITPNATLVVGETFKINEVASGVVSSVGSMFYLPQSVIAGGKNNVNVMEVNKEGAAYTTFVNGSPEFDAYGRLQTSEQHTVANYVHTYDTLANLFTTATAGTGTVTHLPNVSGVLLSVGTDSGAKVVRTSDLYHIYQPGVSQILTFTGSLGDTGKTNVVRRGGLYDDENGIFFEMMGTTFNVVLRSKSTGVVEETRVPSTEWNTDRMDGQGGAFNPSGVMLNPTMDNIFWLDYQWFGAGTVRFGVYVNGKRRVIHSMHHTNAGSQSYMTTGSLPFRYEIENTGVSASTSEFRIFCATVKSEGQFNPRRTLHSASASHNIVSQTSAPVVSIRPKQTFNGIPNRGTMYMYTLMLYNSSDEPMLVSLNRASTTTGGTWADVDTSASIAEVNTTPTEVVGGQLSWSVIIAPKQNILINNDAFDEKRQGFRRKADITIPIEVVISAKLLSGTTGGTLHAVISWDEVRN